MTIEIDRDTALRELRAVVEEYGEGYRYVDEFGREGGEDSAQCQYLHGDEPGCIVGHVLHRLGVSADTLFAFDHASAGGDSQGIRTLASQGALTAHGLVLTLDALDALDFAQDAQDSGYTWGDALARAERMTAA